MSNKVTAVNEDFLDFQYLEDQLSEICDKSEIVECLKKQLLEVEMLQAMYANPGEFVMDNPGQLNDIGDFTSGKSYVIPSGIDFTVNLFFDKMKVELCVALPLDYPVSEPDVFIRNNSFNRDQQQRLNEDFRNYMNSLEKGETCLYAIIYWLQDNVENYANKESPTPQKKDLIVKTTTFSRLWIYSHHIYSKTKRRDMVSIASDVSVTGFVLPGKPGIICVEGNDEDCEEWWSRVKAMNWKKIVVRKKENFPFVCGEKLNKFLSFEEVAFTGNSRNTDNHHMNMGEFHRYLEEHECAYVFVDYFGFNGRTNN